MIEILHPITHDGKEYGRGIHKLTPALEKLFLELKDGDGVPLNVARSIPDQVTGVVTEAPDAPPAPPTPPAPPAPTTPPVEDFLTSVVAKGIVEKRGGNWFYFGEEKLGQGADNVRQFLADNPEVRGRIEAAAVSKVQ